MTLGRFPDGIDGPGFFQMDCRGAPAWLPLAPMRARNGKWLRFCVVNDLPSLLWVANLGTVELHPHNARIDHPEGRATALLLDLDPGPPATLLACCRVALWLKELLDGMGLRAFPKTSGALGLHLLAPLGGEATFAETKPLARQLARTLAEQHPELVVAEMARSARAGKVFVDWGQNDPAKSMIAPYSLRATAERPLVSAPISWEELESAVAEGDAARLLLDPGAVVRRLEEVGDLVGALGAPL